MRKYCNLWRFFDDVEPGWSNNIAKVITYVTQHQDELSRANGPHGWNDPDMVTAFVDVLLITTDTDSCWAKRQDHTRSGKSTNDNLEHLVCMCLVHEVFQSICLLCYILTTAHGAIRIRSAPLIMSNDLRRIDAESKRILINRDVIRIDQDPLGIMGKMVFTVRVVLFELLITASELQAQNISVYLKPMTPIVAKKYSYAIAVLNANVNVKVNSLRLHSVSL